MNKILGRIILFLLLLTTVVYSGFESHRISETIKFDIKTFVVNKASKQSKAQITAEIGSIIGKIQQLEKINQDSRVTIYSPKQTAALGELYQALYARIHFLNFGTGVSATERWDGYQQNYQKESMIYSSDQVKQILLDLEQKVPGKFLKNYRIYLSPYSIPGVSGMGGPGFSVIYAIPKSYQPDTDSLRVTLYHELGHHIHLSYMDETTVTGNRLWNEYHQIRGGSWHGPGKANTVEWSKSSEETFAEDFRMMFGDKQPYFGDMALGDPRDKPAMAQQLAGFISRLSENEKQRKYQSPWIPSEGLNFWLIQNKLIALGWFLVLLALGISYLSPNFYQLNRRITI